MLGVHPSAEEFVALGSRGTLVPVWRELLCDGETPVSAFAKLGHGDHSFLLESVVGGEKWAAYSFIGVGARAIFRARGQTFTVDHIDIEGNRAVTRQSGHLSAFAGDPTRALAELCAGYRPATDAALGLPRFWGGAVGYFAYDVVRAFETLPADAPDELGLPDAAFVIPDTLVIFDNLRQTVKVVAAAFCANGASDATLSASRQRAIERIATAEAGLRRATALVPLALGQPAADEPFSSRTARADFLRSVEAAKELIVAGDVFQVVLSQRFEIERRGVEPFDVYRALRVINPSPYMFHLNFPDGAVTGASPEILVRVEGDDVQLRPIAGTVARGSTAAEDARLEAKLRSDPKELAEHVMLIDLGRNDVGRVAKIGSVTVPERLVVERYSHVMHLVSSVTGVRRPELSALDVLRACFPAGTLTGAPKIRAMQIIDALEPTRRGIYGGAVGYFSFDGNLDMAIAIRTLVTLGDRILVQAGAGIVADSVPEREFDETLNKARAVLRAVALARSATPQKAKGDGEADAAADR